jgi:AcrR family transcriptional regulator
MSPKITAGSIQKQRDWRREQLLAVALELALESPADAEISMTELAKRAGISRTSVYDYFSSSSDVINQVLIGELDKYSSILMASIQNIEDPKLKLESWIRASLDYILSGDHLLAKGMGAITSNPDLVITFKRKHQALLAPLQLVFEELGVKDVSRAMTFTQSVVDTTAKNIERIQTSTLSQKPNAVEREINIAIDLVTTALAALKRA